MEHSIFTLIQNAVTEEGKLSKNFKLPDETPENQSKFVSGAMDGILFYHTACMESEESEGYPLLIKAIECAAEGKTDEAKELVYEFAGKHHVLGYIDLFQEYIINNQKRIPVGNVIEFAINLMLEGTKAEAVKFGMSLLELIDWEQQEQLKKDVRILALEDEFTLYAAFLMRYWENPNKELFEILKKVDGWGRIHLVRMIEADSDEIEEWLIHNGVHNNILPAYSGLDCFEKVHYLERLQSRTLDLKTYRGLADILDAMLDEGPVAGLSAVENKEEVIQAFLEVAKTRTDLKAPRDYVPLIDLEDYISKANQESLSAFGTELSAFLQSQTIKQELHSPIKKHRIVALSALEQWIKSSGRTIQEISPELSEYIQSLLPDEVCEDIRQWMEQILKNEIE